MALITPDNMGTLLDAAAVKTVAEGAPLDAEKTAVAKAINMAANTGSFEILYNHAMSDDLIQYLEGQGYTVTQVPASKTADPEYQYTISWKS